MNSELIDKAFLESDLVSCIDYDVLNYMECLNKFAELIAMTTLEEIAEWPRQAIGHGHLKRTEAETIANARLIAAAPDMLEALKLIQNQDLVLPADREIIKSAIAKAIGER